MRKLYLLLPIIFFVTLSCEDKKNQSKIVILWGKEYNVDETDSLILTPYISPTGELIDSTQLTGSIPPEIGNLTNLTHLYLNWNQLKGSIPSEIGNLTNLQELFLSDNQLTGSIPPEIGNLTNLEVLWLSDNQLTGEIPSEIGNLTNLTLLYLYENQLTGSIPSEIGNLTNLTYLKLSSNQLTGEIPESICDLNLNWSSSSSFNITNNQLCPPYPTCVEDYVGEQDTTNCN